MDGESFSLGGVGTSEHRNTGTSARLQQTQRERSAALRGKVCSEPESLVSGLGGL